MTRMAPLSVLGIFPHPDDEAYSCAGTFARLAERGARVRMVCATNGEGGQDLRADAGGELGAVRAGELRCSCAAIGVEEPRFLGMPDGGLGQVDFADAAGKILAEIRAARPHIVVTLGPDGVYGHPDHLALHRLVIAAFGAAGGGGRFPAERFGEPWAPARLCYTAFPRGMFRPMYEHMLGSEYQTAIRGIDPDKLGVEPPDVTAAVDIRSVSDKKLAAIACHRSQLRNGDPLTLFPDGLVRRLLTTELFELGAGLLPERRWRDLDEDLEPWGE